VANVTIQGLLWVSGELQAKRAAIAGTTQSTAIQNSPVLGIRVPDAEQQARHFRSPKDQKAQEACRECENQLAREIRNTTCSRNEWLKFNAHSVNGPDRTALPTSLMTSAQ
jgi:hypothetical protein